MVQNRGFIEALTLLLLCITLSCASLLPSLQNLSIQSVNMRHLLKWSPLQEACGTVQYSVKFQGEYETHMLNGSWVDSYDCQRISQTQCDLTLDLGSDSDYSIGVQAQCGDQTSWTQLPSAFNRRDTELVAPNMSVSVTGSLIQVDFTEVHPQITISLRVWREGDEQNASSQVIKAQPYQFSFDTQQNGGTHCVKAEARLESLNKSSSIETNCISVPKLPSGWIKPVAVSAAVVISVFTALALGWRLPRCLPRLRQTMCTKKQLPSALLEDWPPRTPTFPCSVQLEPTHPLTLLHPSEEQDGAAG